MRTGITDRYYRTFTYQDVDRVPDVEFGYWAQTIRRWLKEGLPLQLTPEETEDMFSRKLNNYFGFEHEGRGIPILTHMNPSFEEEIIERRGASVIMRGRDGILAQRFLNDVDESSIPHFIKFPVETPDD